MKCERHLLAGCRPVPLAHYLKALGVLRLVAEQADQSARGAWDGDSFWLETQLDRAALIEFFLSTYQPTPIIAPWNGGSGFYPKDNAVALNTIASSQSSRFAAYRQTITAGQTALGRLGITDKVGKEQKLNVLHVCRGSFPDSALDWLDAAFVLTNERALFPPLLGTGGNDGRLDFTNNFMRRLLELLEPSSGTAIPAADALLNGALFDDTTDSLKVGAAIGQFLPGSAGGANASTDFDADSVINPWDFVLMLEGAALFAVAAVRRLSAGTSAGAASPFTVRQSGVGYASASSADEEESRGEMWLPLWSRPIGLPELRALLAEGRARIGGRDARDGVDFARAVATLGVDRGIDAFQRYGFQVRNGLAYFATPLERLAVRARPRVRFLDEIDHWLGEFHRRVKGSSAPASASRAARALDASIMNLCRRDDGPRLLEVLIALGRCERVMATSQRWVDDKKAPLAPIAGVSPDWLKGADDGSVELRLAAAMASVCGRYRDRDGRERQVPLRVHFEPVSISMRNGGQRVNWHATAGRDVAWGGGSLEQSLLQILERRVLLTRVGGHGGYADRGRQWAELGDIADFIAGRVDDRRLVDLIWACLLIDWSQSKGRLLAGSPVSGAAPAFYGLMKLCFPGGAHSDRLEVPTIPIVPRILRLAAAGNGHDAATQAIRRLRGSGCAPAVQTLHLRGRQVIRSAAALLFPLGSRDLAHIRFSVLRPTDASPSDHLSTTDESGATP